VFRHGAIHDDFWPVGRQAAAARVRQAQALFSELV